MDIDDYELDEKVEWYNQHTIEWLGNMIQTLEEQKRNGFNNINYNSIPAMLIVRRRKLIKTLLDD